MASDITYYLNVYPFPLTGLMVEAGDECAFSVEPIYTPVSSTCYSVEFSLAFGGDASPSVVVSADGYQTQTVHLDSSSETVNVTLVANLPEIEHIQVGSQTYALRDPTKQAALTAAQLAAVNSGITAANDYIIEKGTDSAGQTYLKFKSGVLMVYFVGTSVSGLSATYNWVVPFVAAPTVVGCLGNAGLLPAEWSEQTVNVGASSAQFNWRQTSGGGYVYIIALGSWK